MRRPARALALGAGIAALFACAFSSGVSARSLYVTNYDSDTVSVIDGLANQVVGPPISTGPESGPFTLAIAPDGRTVYTADYKGGSVTPIDTLTNQAGAPIPIEKNSYGIAITPDGSRAYVANSSNGSVTAVDLAARQVIGEPIPICPNPNAVTITPDGTHAYVSCKAEVRVLDLATNQVVGPPIPAGSPYGSAITPDGRTLFVADEAGLVDVIDTATNQAAVPPIPAGDKTSQIAITPDGSRAYASDYGGDRIFMIDTATKQLIGSPIEGVKEPEYMAISPDGRKLFAAQFELGSVSGLDTTTSQLLGAIPAGKGVGGLAFVPDQSPLASFSVPKRVRPGVATILHGSTSSDPDGTVATYSWQFGDGASWALGVPRAPHKFVRPGRYSATLTVTDNEGCSVAMVFTGQTAYCHGSPAATLTKTVKVAYPGVRARCPAGSRARVCKFRLQAVQRTGKGKRRRLKALSAVARVKVRHGKATTVSLKARRKYRGKLARARKVLVRRVVTIGRRTTTRVVKLKIVE